MNNGNGVNGDGVGSIGVAKVTTVHDPEYRVGDAAEAALLFNKSLLIIPGDGRYSGHWVITKVNERSVAVTSQIDDENNFKETEGVERNSVKFNLTFDQLKSLDVKILPGAFGAEACIVRCEHHRFFQRVCVCFDCWLRGCAATSWSFGLISLELVSVVDN